MQDAGNLRVSWCHVAVLSCLVVLELYVADILLQVGIGTRGVSLLSFLYFFAIFYGLTSSRQVGAAREAALAADWMAA